MVKPHFKRKEVIRDGSNLDYWNRVSLHRYQ